MRCPFCGHEETAVKDSRPAEDNSTIRRRRSCPGCAERFTTFERIQLRELTVIKNDGKRQVFDRDKVIKSMQVALRKRPVNMDQIETAANAIVRDLESSGESEIISRQIGEQVMKALAHLDTVGYIRYASVYKDFRNPEDFNEFLGDLHRLQKVAAE
ncbi:MAG: transcriptional regulator NrdR [Alphaproteobacteria bacterium]|jgi:transcriptional repressor NrdR|nr:transcriptional regulator NrdR [Alphaproteobacteria bacterium]MBU0859986.1 transcriptional regulator NrdR [Alphaproteobacteria bacterium]